MGALLRLTISILPILPVANALNLTLSSPDSRINDTTTKTSDGPTFHRNIPLSSSSNTPNLPPILEATDTSLDVALDRVEIQIATSLAPIPVPPWPSTPNALSALLPALETYYGSTIPTCWPCQWPSTVLSGGESTRSPFPSSFTSDTPPSSSATEGTSSEDGSSATTTLISTRGTESSLPSSTGAIPTTASLSETSPTSVPSEPTSGRSSVTSTADSSSAQSSFATITTAPTLATSDIVSSTSMTSSALPSDFIAPAPPASSARRMIPLSCLQPAWILMAAWISL